MPNSTTLTPEEVRVFEHITVSGCHYLVGWLTAAAESSPEITKTLRGFWVCTQRNDSHMRDAFRPLTADIQIDEFATLTPQA